MEKRDIRMIAMDMDGTLLTHSDTGPAFISPENMRALRAADRAGIRLCIASGRMPDDAAQFAAEAGLPMSILSLNGSCIQCLPDEQPESCGYISPDAADTVWRYADAKGLQIGMFRGNTLVLNYSLDGMPDYRKWGTYLDRPGSRAKVYVDGENARACIAAGVSKFVILSAGHDDRLQALRIELERTRPELEISSSWVNNIEINPASVHKGSGLRRVADRLGIPMNQVMAIGDNSNDIPMIRAAGFGVAMGNATADTMAAADYHTLSCGEHGVAAAIRVLALGEAIKGVTRQW